MKLNNKGMTLIEMIVAFAILGVVSVSILSMMITGTRTYTRFTYAEKLQQETQLAMANMERHIMNCNEGISWSEGTDRNSLFMVSEEGTTRILKVIYFDKATKELYYGEGDLGADGTSANLNFYLLAEHVKDLDVTLTDTASVSGIRKQAEINLTMERNGKTNLITKNVALRNQPLNCNGSLSGSNVTVVSGS